MEMETSMEHPSLIGHSHSQLRQDEPEFDLKEWSMKDRIRRENNRGSSRRYSASFIGTLREDEEAANKSFRSHAFTISSTTSSPGSTLKGDIDPSTYSFTTALKALKSKNIYSWEQMSPEGRLPLNSKWSEAERYICNPLSGEVPLECLSAKTLSARSFHHFSGRITISTPNMHPLPPRHLQRKPSTAIHEDELKFQTQEEKIDIMKIDGGMESPRVNMDSSNPRPVTPSIEERAIKRSGAESEDSLESSDNRKFDGEEETKEANDDKQEGTQVNEGENDQNVPKKMSSSRQGAGGCFLLWRTLWKKRNNERLNIHKIRKKNIFLCQKIGCLKE